MRKRLRHMTSQSRADAPDLVPETYCGAIVSWRGTTTSYERTTCEACRAAEQLDRACRAVGTATVEASHA
jgi:hypothetical protein